MKILLMFMAFCFVLFNLIFPLEIPITLQEYTGITRVNEPMLTSVPLPLGFAHPAHLDQFRLVDATSTEIPSQYKVTMLWPDGSIRWVVTQFLGNVSARGTSAYTLKFDKGTGSYQGVTVDDGTTHVTINTGAMIFKIKKSNGFNLFDQVLIDKDGDGQVNDEIISSNVNDGGIIDDTYYTGNDNGFTIEVEEAGPVRAVVMVKGDHTNSSNATRYGYRVRIFAYAGQSYVRVRYIMRNCYYVQQGYPSFDEMSVNTEVNLGSSKTVTIFGSSEVSGSLSNSAYIYQGSGTNFEVKNGTSTLQSGGRCLGWLDLSDGSWGVSCGILEFVGNFPNEIYADDQNNIKVKPFPGRSSASYFIGIGETKTHDLVYYFHKGNATSANVSDVMGGLHHYIYPTCTKSWIAKTRAFPQDIGPTNDPIPAPASLQLPMVPANAMTAAPCKGFYWGPNANYSDGWIDFGEELSNNGSGDQEIFDCFGAAFASLLDPRYLRQFKAHALHRSDFRRYHVDDVIGKSVSGLNDWYPQSSSSGSDPGCHKWYCLIGGTSGGGSIYGHYCVLDVFLYYILTGEEKAKLAVFEAAEVMGMGTWTWLMNNYGGPGQGSGNLRPFVACQLPWIFSYLIEPNPHRTYHQSKISDIMLIFLVLGVQSSGTHYSNPDRVSPFMQGLTTWALCWYHEYFSDSASTAAVRKNADWWRDFGIGDLGYIGYSSDESGYDTKLGSQSNVSQWRDAAGIQRLSYYTQDSLLQVRLNLFTGMGSSSVPYFKNDLQTLYQAHRFYLAYKDSGYFDNPMINFFPLSAEPALPKKENADMSVYVFPNPFNPSATIRLNRGQKPETRGQLLNIQIYNTNGQMVDLLASGYWPLASDFTWNAANHPAGLYILKVHLGKKQLTQKLMLIK